MNHPYIVKTLFNLEQCVADELKHIGASNINILNRAVSFEGDLELLYKANYTLRTAIKIIVPIAKFSVSNEKDLYENVSKINWNDYMNNTCTFAVDTALNTDLFNHSHFVSLKTKDAIVDQFRNKTGERPNIDLVFPEYRVNVHIYKDECTISMDSSGESLHKRGYRLEQDVAPLSEVLAAGIIKLSDWKGEKDFYDPMCGSGTILIEAAMLALQIPAQKFRHEFSFMNWKNFDRQLWKKVRNEEDSKIKDKLDCKIYGSELSFSTLRKARENVTKSGLSNYIQLERKDFKKLTPHGDSGIIVCNPPYGERIELEELKEFYNMIGDKLKQDFNGFDAWFLSTKEALKFVGLKTSKRFAIYNAKLECKFHKYEMYRGSKKGKYMTNSEDVTPS